MQPASIEPLSSHNLFLAFARFVDYAETAWGHSQATLKGYKCGYQNFEHFLASPDAESIPEDIRIYAIEAWVQWNRRRKLSAISLNAYWRALRVFYRYLSEVEGVPNPFTAAKMPKAPKTLPKARSVDDCRRILAAARSYPWPHAFFRARAVAMLATMIYAGLRKKEVLRLEYADIDLHRGTIRVVKGKGRFGGKDRTAYMPLELKKIYEEYLSERKRLGLTGPEFFLSPRTNRGLSESQLVRLVRVTRNASGVPYSMHSLRHSFVSFLLASGTPIHVARDLAGHEDIETTARYLKVFDEEKQFHIRKLRLG